MSLVELLIALTVSAIVVTTVSALTFQLYRTSARSSDYSLAFTQVQNAGAWVSHDGVMAQEVYTRYTETVSPFLTLEWDSYDEAEHYQVGYRLESSSEGLTRLVRDYYVDTVLQESVIVAGYIVADSTDCTWDETLKVIAFTITCQVGDQTVARTYEMRPRPLTES